MRCFFRQKSNKHDLNLVNSFSPLQHLTSCQFKVNFSSTLDLFLVSSRSAKFLNKFSMAASGYFQFRDKRRKSIRFNTLSNVMRLQLSVAINLWKIKFKRAIFRLRNSIASLSFLLDSIATSILLWILLVWELISILCKVIMCN